MGGWKLEVAKMTLYMAFPVLMFHYFNQPEFFEEWVIKKKREIYPPENKSYRAAFEEVKKQILEREEQEMLKAMEEKQ